MVGDSVETPFAIIIDQMETTEAVNAIADGGAQKIIRKATGARGVVITDLTLDIA